MDDNSHNDVSAQVISCQLTEKETVIKRWNEASNHGVGSQELLLQRILEYLSFTAIKVYTEENENSVLKAVLKENDYVALIESYFEEFLFGPHPDQKKAEIKALCKPPALCGKVFEVGDPTYTCKDCAADPTCVFCNDCFRQSAHINHRYRLHTSAGMGGFCDCGDGEAWKQDPCCQSHKSGASLGIDENVLETLPPEFLKKARQLYSALLQYCVDMLCWSENDILPEGLTNEDGNDSYVCILFNDESHTYAEVIRALCTVVHCDRAAANVHATIVDKQGRGLIYSGTKDKCVYVSVNAKTLTSTGGKNPLKCEAILKHIVAHQLVALRLLDWIYQLSSMSDGLRRLLCILSVNPIGKRPESLLTQILKADTNLWKAARASCHHLFMNLVLIDPYGKQEYAACFIKEYKHIMKDFIQDDHVHSISASSMSVQIFTVPTLAMKLITEHRALQTVLEMFYEHIEPAINYDGVIEFQSQVPGSSRVSLKRACYVLHDLGYLLHHKPTAWTPHLRVRFLNAFDVFLKIITAMQGMDSVVRKGDSHIEFEPNWESGFLLQFWIMPIIEDMLAWCTSDAKVLQKSVRKCIAILSKMKHKFVQKNNLEIEPGHVTIDYDVASQAVTVHLPLSRFLAGLLTGCAKYGFTLKDTMHLEEVGVKGYVALMEYSLRSLVLTAQVSARMWRRNGYAILSQVSYYQNVRCVSEMYDRDIIMLQIVATCMDADHFLTALLDKYGLLDWIRLDYNESQLDEDQQGRIIVLSEEFLFTVLAVVGERHVMGVGQVNGKDIIEREVIHQLALEPASRSEIVKNLPCKDPDDDENCNFEALLDAVLDTVADFKKPGVTGKGIYELKKKYVSECSQYFYHFTRSEQSKALEIRRKESKKKQPFIFRPPPPPKFTTPFASVTKLFHCTKFTKLIAVILLRTLNGTSNITPETVIEEALYLVAVGIQDQKRELLEDGEIKADFFDVLTRTLGVINGKSFTLLSLLQELNATKSKEEFAGLVTWILEESSHLHSESSADLSEKSKADQDAELEKERKAMLAREKREKVMAQISAMQKAFAKSNKHLLDFEEGASPVDEEDNQAIVPEVPVAVGPKKQRFKARPENVTCILCQEKQDVTSEGKTVVLAALVQRSKVLSGSKGKSLETVTDYNPLFAPVDLFTGVNVTSCGHVMHSDCWEEYFKSVIRKDDRQAARFHHFHSVNVKKNEYMCPLCISLCNTALPFLPIIPEVENESVVNVDTATALETDDLLISLHQLAARQMEECLKQEADSSFSLTSTIKSFVWNFARGGASLTTEIKNVLKIFSQSVFVAGLRSEPDENSPRYVTISWSCCSYSIQCAEAWSREERHGLFGSLTKQQVNCIGALVRYAAVAHSLASIQTIKKHAAKLLTVFSPYEISGASNLSIMELNIFGIMVNLRFALSGLQGFLDTSGVDYLMGAKLDEAVLRLGLLALIVQVLMYTTEHSFDNTKDTDDVMEDADNDHGPEERLSYLWGLIHCWMGLTPTSEPFKDGRRLLMHVQATCHRFLRCCAIFFHFLTGIPVPKCLEEEDSCGGNSEFQGLCSYLSVPLDLTELIGNVQEAEQDSPIVSLIKRWCWHEQVKYIVAETKCENVMLMPEPNKLIPLPVDYCQLINSASGFRCASSGDASCSPALCLVCGEMLCSQSYCCQTMLDGKQVGSCTAHAHHCSDGVGIFLRIRECEIVLLFFTNKGCLIPSPYLDEYGEPDHGFRRGNPLFLSVERYNNLQRLWLSHWLPDEISRQMESNRRIPTYDWSQI